MEYELNSCGCVMVYRSGARTSATSGGGAGVFLDMMNCLGGEYLGFNNFCLGL